MEINMPIKDEKNMQGNVLCIYPYTLNPQNTLLILEVHAGKDQEKAQS